MAPKLRRHWLKSVVEGSDFVLLPVDLYLIFEKSSMTNLGFNPCPFSQTNHINDPSRRIFS